MRRDGSFSEFGRDPERLADAWAAKHAEWQRVRDLTATAGWGAYEPEGGGRRRAELWLSAGPGRRIRAVAERAGLQPAQVLAQLAERVMVGEDGTVSVPPFTPSR
ncbi:hypothetical protein ACFYO2_48775 [Streptomyces sp. NPDC006602]|uniref:hypothetical protein n=1 Tax=Streptomyces sp. NPDC006602 TaxID=3364751 RepID=UPI0036BFE43F